jgi:hypothetical protein
VQSSGCLARVKDGGKGSAWGGVVCEVGSSSDDRALGTGAG